MAGKPLRRQTAEVVAANGGIEAALEKIAAGTTVTQVARDLGVPVTSLSDLLRKPELMDRYVTAKKAGADAFIEKGIQAVESATPQDAAVAKLQWDMYKYMAQRLDPDNWDDKKQPSVNISIGDLHLDALKKRPITIEVTPQQVDE